MSTMDRTSQPGLPERMASLESAINTERPHLATKADLERQTRLIVMWFVGLALTLLGLIIGVFLHLNEQLNAILRSLP